MRPRFLVALVVGGSLLASASAPRAQDRRAQVVVRIGQRTITTGELEDRLAQVPTFQLMSFGDTPDAIKKRFTDEVIVPEALLSMGAEDKHLDKDPLVAYRLERARANATQTAVRTQQGPASAISMDDVRAWYDAHKDKFDSPERVQVWRILCASREDAQAVLDAAKKDPSPAKWNDLARDKSLDKATYLRGGNLGFLAPDGTSNEPGVKVDPAIVQAASKVRDGQLVADPVEEHGQDEPRWSVVWRRGTIAPSKRSVEDAAAQIRASIWQERVESANKKLLADLRAAKVKELNMALLDSIDVTPTDGMVRSRHKPASASSK